MNRNNFKENWMVRQMREFAAMNISVYAANACYFLVLAIFPGLLLVLASVPYLPYAADDIITLIAGLMPQALMPSVEQFVVSTYYSASGTIVSISAVAALWSASRGVAGLVTGLNHIYQVEENRGNFYIRILSVGYTLVFLVILALTLVLQVFGKSISQWLQTMDYPLIQILLEVLDLRFAWLLGVQILVFAVMYTVLPNRRNPFLSTIPGSVVAAVGWQLFSNAFSLYVQYFPSYSNIYGSVYALALGMLWLYCCISIFLFGGGVNKLILQWIKL